MWIHDNLDSIVVTKNKTEISIETEFDDDDDNVKKQSIRNIAVFTNKYSTNPLSEYISIYIPDDDLINGMYIKFILFFCFVLFLLLYII